MSIMLTQEWINDANTLVIRFVGTGKEVEFDLKDPRYRLFEGEEVTTFEIDGRHSFSIDSDYSGWWIEKGKITIPL